MKKMSLGIFTTPLIFHVDFFSFYYSSKETIKSYYISKVGNDSECIPETNHYLLGRSRGEGSEGGKLHSKDTDIQKY